MFNFTAWPPSLEPEWGEREELGQFPSEPTTTSTQVRFQVENIEAGPKETHDLNECSRVLSENIKLQQDVLKWRSVVSKQAQQIHKENEAKCRLSAEILKTKQRLRY